MTEYLVTSASNVWFNMGQDSLKPNDRIEDIVNVAIPKPLEDYCEKVDTVEMTKDEKSEFDKIKESFTSLSMAFEVIIINDEDGIPYPNLYSRLFENSNPEEDNTAQLEFSRIWEKPELIEVPK